MKKRTGCFLLSLLSCFTFIYPIPAQMVLASGEQTITSALPAPIETDNRLIWLTDGEVEEAEALALIIQEQARDKYGYALPLIQFVTVQNEELTAIAKDTWPQGGAYVGVVTTHSKEICEELKEADLIFQYYDLNDRNSLEKYNDYNSVKCDPGAQALDTLGQYLIYPFLVAPEAQNWDDDTVVTYWDGAINVPLNYWDEWISDLSDDTSNQ